MTTFSAPPTASLGNGAGSFGSFNPVSAYEDEQMEMETALDGFEVVPEVTLDGAPIPAGAVEAWSKTRNMGFVMNPVLANGIAWFDSKTADKVDSKSTSQDLALYPTTTNVSDEWTDAYRVFAREAFATTLGPQTSHEITQRYADFLETIDQYQKKLREDSDEVPTAEPFDDAYSIALCIYATYFQNGATAQSGYFGSQSTYQVREPLLEWVNVTDQSPSVSLGEEIMAHVPPVQHSNFWRYIYQLLCRGMLKQANYCLSNSGADSVDPSSEEALGFAVDLINRYPRDGNVSFYFRQWHASIAKTQSTLLQIHNASIQKGFTTLFDLLSGEEPAILATCNNWYDALVALQQFQDPADARMRGYYDTAVGRLPIDPTMSWEVGASHAIKGELLLAIHTIEACDSVIAALVCNMCYEAGLLSGYGAVNDAALPDRYLESFAVQCIGYGDLIPVGVEVLQKIREVTRARQILGLLLPRLTYDTAPEISWALKTCKNNGLLDVEAQIRKTLAQKSLSDGFYLQGLAMLAKAGNIAAVRHQSWQLFKQGLVFGQAVEDPGLKEYIDSPGSFDDVPAEVTECLAPYAVLTKFFALKRSGQKVKSAQYLLALFEFPLMPTQYLVLLISELIPFVSRSTVSYFTTAQYMTFIAAFNKWEKAKGTEAYDQGLELIAESVEKAGEDDWRQGFDTKELVYSQLNLARMGVATMSSRNNLA